MMLWGGDTLNISEQHRLSLFFFGGGDTLNISEQHRLSLFFFGSNFAFHFFLWWGVGWGEDGGSEK